MRVAPTPSRQAANRCHLREFVASLYPPLCSLSLVLCIFPLFGHHGKQEIMESQYNGMEPHGFWGLSHVTTRKRGNQLSPWSGRAVTRQDDYTLVLWAEGGQHYSGAASLVLGAAIRRISSRRFGCLGRIQNSASNKGNRGSKHGIANRKGWMAAL